MWCVPKLDEDYIRRMDDVLALYERPYNAAEPVVCIDERPVSLHDSVRAGSKLAQGKLPKTDYEYVRCGVANIFGIVEPKVGRHLTYASENRKKAAFGAALKTIADAYPDAEKIHLVMDNLNTHTIGSVITAFEEDVAINLWERFEIHYTPKHASWLNQAEIELSLWSRQCLGKRRIPSLDKLASETAHWTNAINLAAVRFNWRFTRQDAKNVFDGNSLKSARSEH
jgi:hypothetical protein